MELLPGTRLQKLKAGSFNSKDERCSMPDSQSNNPSIGLPYVQWVIKISKLCNLRCTYCYEYPELGNRNRMSLDEVYSMFQNIATYYASSTKKMDFVWHGGEPLLAGHEFYWRVHEMQHEIFDPVEINFSNSIQTNLTFLHKDQIKLMREFFAEVGISIDLFGDQRIDRRGTVVQSRVLDNMQRLINEKVNFGCITVLSRLTAPHVEKIYQFFEDIQVSFRLLPIYRTGYKGQNEEMALSDIEIVEVLKRVTDHWFMSDSLIHVEPVAGYVAHVLHHLSGPNKKTRYYDKERDEVIFIVDTDGSVYSNGDAYDTRLRHGNIFTDSFRDMRSSRGFIRALEESRQRVNEACSLCRYYGSCSGFFMGESTPEQRWKDSNGSTYCGVAAPIQQYIEQKLVACGLVDTSTNRLKYDEMWRRAFQG